MGTDSEGCGSGKNGAALGVGLIEKCPGAGALKLGCAMCILGYLTRRAGALGWGRG